MAGGWCGLFARLPAAPRCAASVPRAGRSAARYSP